MQAPDALGSKSLSGQDLQWLKRKQDVFQGANFKSFVSQLYDARDPGQAALLDKVYPALNAEREQIIDQRAELEKRLAKIRLRGPQGESDLKLLFAISSGAIQPPQGVLYDPKTWFAAGTEQARLQRGLFNPRRLFAGQTDKKFMPFDKLWGVMPSANTVPLRYGGVPASNNQFGIQPYGVQNFTPGQTQAAYQKYGARGAGYTGSPSNPPGGYFAS